MMLIFHGHCINRSINQNLSGGTIRPSQPTHHINSPIYHSSHIMDHHRCTPSDIPMTPYRTASDIATTSYSRPSFSSLGPTSDIPSLNSDHFANSVLHTTQETLSANHSPVFPAPLSPRNMFSISILHEPRPNQPKMLMVQSPYFTGRQICGYNSGLRATVPSASGLGGRCESPDLSASELDHLPGVAFILESLLLHCQSIADAESGFFAIHGPETWGEGPRLMFSVYPACVKRWFEDGLKRHPVDADVKPCFAAFQWPGEIEAMDVGWYDERGHVLMNLRLGQRIQRKQELGSKHGTMMPEKTEEIAPRFPSAMRRKNRPRDIVVEKSNSAAKTTRGRDMAMEARVGQVEVPSEDSESESEPMDKKELEHLIASVRAMNIPANSKSTGDHEKQGKRGGRTQGSSRRSNWRPRSRGSSRTRGWKEGTNSDGGTALGGFQASALRRVSDDSKDPGRAHKRRHSRLSQE